ncbi:MAG: GGDEF domain-containing protein [Gammaproteobacteria bacterium]|nr:GGDEF domain-containing protein [Gammaproteobacteria bacterium]
MQLEANTDPLTGALNRRSGLRRLERMVERGTEFALIFLDLREFKSINDQHGHPEGDEALKLVAARLRSEVPEPAFIGRLGGEEFVVVLPDSNVEAGRQLADRFRESVTAIDTRRWLADRRLTVSIGMTLSKAGGDNPSYMLQRADAALYEAKRAGRNCVRLQLPAQAEITPVAPLPGSAQREARMSTTITAVLTASDQ